MDLKQIQNDIAQGGLLIDVRSPEEYAEGHVKDALLIPHTQFFTADIQLKKTIQFTFIVKWDLGLTLLQQYFMREVIAMLPTLVAWTTWKH